MKSKSVGMGSSTTTGGTYNPEHSFATVYDYEDPECIGAMDIDYHELICQENKYLSTKVKVATAVAGVSLLTLCIWFLIRKQRD